MTLSERDRVDICKAVDACHDGRCDKAVMWLEVVLARNDPASATTCCLGADPSCKGGHPWCGPQEPAAPCACDGVGMCREHAEDMLDKHPVPAPCEVADALRDARARVAPQVAREREAEQIDAATMDLRFGTPEPAPCETCGGTGVQWSDPYAEPRRCPNGCKRRPCDGSGWHKSKPYCCVGCQACLPICDGSGYLRDQVQAWDCGEPAKECPGCPACTKPPRLHAPCTDESPCQDCRPSQDGER